MPHCYSTVSCNNGKMGYYYFIAFFSLLFRRYLSLRQLYLISYLSVTPYLFPLLPAQESFSRSLSRKLPPISPPHFPVLAADLTSPRRWSHRLILHNSPPISSPQAPVLVDLVGFGFWFRLRLWVVSQVTSMGWVEVVGCGFDGLIRVIWVEVVGCGRIMDRVWDWVLIWVEVLGWASMAWFRWEVSHSDCAVFVFVVGGCRLRSGGRWRLLGPGLCFFFLLPIAIVCGCGW